MLAFVDESGDLGVRVDQGSSPFFVLAVVLWSDTSAATRCDRRIDSLRRELGLRANFEFHYARNSRRQRRAFLHAVSEFPFRSHLFCLDKERAGGDLQSNPMHLYRWCLMGALDQAAQDGLHAGTLVIDRFGGRTLRREIQRDLRGRRDTAGTPIVKSVRMQRSGANNLLQLADYVAGITSRSLKEEVEGVGLRRRYLRRHEGSRRVWP